jgi:hypothetical protein
MKGSERRTHPLETSVSEVFCRDGIHQNHNISEEKMCDARYQSFMKHKTYFVLLPLVTLGERVSPDFEALLGGTDTS